MTHFEYDGSKVESSNDLLTCSVRPTPVEFTFAHGRATKLIDEMGNIKPNIFVLSIDTVYWLGIIGMLSKRNRVDNGVGNDFMEGLH